KRSRRNRHPQKVARVSRVVLSIQKGDHYRDEIWDTERPFQLGHPVLWIFRKTKSGVEIQNARTPEERFRLVRDLELPSFPGQPPWHVRVRKTNPFLSPQRSFGAAPSAHTEHLYGLFGGIGDCVLTRQAVGDKFRVYEEEERVFSYRRVF